MSASISWKCSQPHLTPGSTYWLAVFGPKDRIGSIEVWERPDRDVPNQGLLLVAGPFTVVDPAQEALSKITVHRGALDCVGRLEDADRPIELGGVRADKIIADLANAGFEIVRLKAPA